MHFGGQEGSEWEDDTKTDVSVIISANVEPHGAISDHFGLSEKMKTFRQTSNASSEDLIPLLFEPSPQSCGRRPDRLRLITPVLNHGRVLILRFAHSRQGYPSDLLVWGFHKYGGHFSENKKERLRQRTHKLGASKHMGAIFLNKKKVPAATYPQVTGFQTCGGHFSMCHFKPIFPCGASARVFVSLQSDLSTATLLCRRTGRRTA